MFARSVGRDPEATSPATPATTSRPPTATTSSNEGDTQESANVGSTSHVGAIVGGVVGGIFGLATITAIVFFLKKRRRRTQQVHVIDLGSDMDTRAQWDTMQMQNAHKTQRLYDPSDPSTYPTPISVTGDSYTPPQTYNGKYTGSAEI